MEKKERHYIAKEASEKALEWCNNNKGWVRMCDLEDDSSSLYKTWEELSNKEQYSWIREYGKLNAKSAWEEFGYAPCKVPYGFITGKGEFYNKITEVPEYHNVMMVFKIK